MGPSGPPEREDPGPSGPPEREDPGPSGPPEREDLELSGCWRAAPWDDDLGRRFPDVGFSDRDWAELAVPGHWRSTPGLEACDGPVLHRRAFEAAAPDIGHRSFVVFEGCFEQGYVWLDGSYLGDTEGYFVPHAFEVTDQLRARGEHVLAVELSCSPLADETPRRKLVGALRRSVDLDPDWNPGGIWRPVRLRETGPVRIASLRLRCTEATPERARLHLTADLDAAEPADVELRTTVTPERPIGAGISAAENVHRARLTAGRNEVTWWVDVADPTLWWPRALSPGQDGAALVDVEVQASVVGPPSGNDAASGSSVRRTPSDTARRRTGLRQVRMKRGVLEVNGERMFVKGAGVGPTRLALGEATGAEVERDVALALDAGLDMLAVHAHIGRPELYEAADRAGLLLWQDITLRPGTAPGRRSQTVRQARAAVDLLAHHPSVARWCPRGGTLTLDTSVARMLERFDGSRPVLPPSGQVPGAAWGIDTHISFGWRHGNERDLPRWLRRFPVLARFVGEFGAQAVPETAAWMEPERWPDLDWDQLGHTHGLQKEIFDRRVPPADYSTFAAWRAATQEHQATVIRHHVEELRRLKYRSTGGFCQLLLADSHPAVSWSVLDHERVPKASYAAFQAACAPVIVVADRPAASYHPGAAVALDVHVVSDLRHPLTGCTVKATLTWPGGSHRWGFVGELPADSVARVGTLSFVVADAPGPLTLDLRLEGAAAGTATYCSEIAPHA